MFKKIGQIILIPFIAIAGLFATPVWAEYTIGLAVANLQADFFNQIKQSVEAEGKRVGASVVVVDARGDSATQVSQIQDLITREVDAIIYIPAGATAATVPVKAARKAGVPIVTVDRNPEVRLVIPSLQLTVSMQHESLESMLSNSPEVKVASALFKVR